MVTFALPTPVAHAAAQLADIQPAVFPQPVAPAGAQPADLAADCNEKDANTLLKLFSRAHFTEAFGIKVRRRSYIYNLELFLRISARPVYHWGYLLLASLGTNKFEKVRRSHLATAVADYSAFNNGVETLFGKFQFEESYQAMLRTHSQAGSESVAAYAAHTKDVCSKAYTGFSTETQLSLAVDHFIAGLAYSTSRDYLLHDRAAARSPGKRLCKWHWHLKPRASRCTHLLQPLPLRVQGQRALA